VLEAELEARRQGAVPTPNVLRPAAGAVPEPEAAPAEVAAGRLAGLGAEVSTIRDAP
jgi:hypothetical protein